MKHYKNIIFDLCGPIITLNLDLMDNKFHEFGVSVEHPYRTLYDAGITKRYESGLISTQEFNEMVRETFSCHISDSQILESWNTVVESLPIHHVELIKKLHQKYNTFLLSNSDEVNAKYFSEYLNSHAGFLFTEECFTEVFFSYQLKDRKPSPNVFKHILRKHNLNPEETLFIDDCRKHCLTASSLGINTCKIPANRDICELFDEDLNIRNELISELNEL